MLRALTLSLHWFYWCTRFWVVSKVSVPLLLEGLRQRDNGKGRILRYPLRGEADFREYCHLYQDYGDHPRTLVKLIGMSLSNPVEFQRLSEFDEFLVRCTKSPHLLIRPTLRVLEKVYLSHLMIKQISPDERKTFEGVLAKIRSTRVNIPV